jgi:hypothetical protein
MGYQVEQVKEEGHHSAGCSSNRAQDQGPAQVLPQNEQWIESVFQVLHVRVNRCFMLHALPGDLSIPEELKGPV